MGLGRLLGLVVGEHGEVSFRYRSRIRFPSPNPNLNYLVGEMQKGPKLLSWGGRWSSQIVQSLVVVSRCHTSGHQDEMMFNSNIILLSTNLKWSDKSFLFAFNYVKNVIPRRSLFDVTHSYWQSLSFTLWLNTSVCQETEVSETKERIRSLFPSSIQYSQHNLY